MVKSSPEGIESMEADERYVSSGGVEPEEEGWIDLPLVPVDPSPPLLVPCPPGGGGSPDGRHTGLMCGVACLLGGTAGPLGGAGFLHY